MTTREKLDLAAIAAIPGVLFTLFTAGAGWPLGLLLSAAVFVGAWVVVTI
ncbi:hypothetical protein [Azospirillum sp. ST 5-10]